MSKKTPWLMLFSRLALFLAVQSLFALAFLLAGAEQPWNQAANWWLLTVTLADAICLVLLMRIFNAEGKRFWDLFRIQRATLKGDLLLLLAVTLLAAPVSYFPNVWLGQALFGDSAATLDLLVRPMPLSAVYVLLVLFPVAQGLTELPTYFGYVMPRFRAQGMNKWLAIALPASMLGLQHIAAPLLLDMRFVAWRGGMYLPFAFLVGAVLYWRPRLLPYLVAIHVLMDLSFAAMFLNAAT
jgi:hypothetical protein